MRASTRARRAAFAALLPVLVAGVVGVLTLAGVAAAQDPPPPAAPPTASAGAAQAELSAACLPLDPKKAPRVTAASRAGGPKAAAVELGDTLAVEVRGLATLAAQERCWQEIDGDDRRIVLYLDGRPLPDREPVTEPGPGTGELRFDLRRTADSREVWAHLLGRPGFDPRKVEVSVGIAGRFAIPSAATVGLRALPGGPFLFWLLLFAGLVAGFFLLARRTELLRDDVAEPGPGKRRPYSLARTQAAWWFFLIVAAYLFLGVVTGDWTDTITGSVVVLLGIAAGTTLGSTVIDASKDTPAAQREQQNAIKRLKPLADKPDASEAIQSQLSWLRNENVFFVRDLLSDATGVTFHRFQMVAWTLVLGLVFVFEVYRQLAMPQFSETLLSLMGISSGTFLGMKIPEDTAPKPAADEPVSEPPAEGNAS